MKTPTGSDAFPEFGERTMKSRDDDDGVGCTDDGFSLGPATVSPVDSVNLEKRKLLLERQNIDLQTGMRPIEKEPGTADEGWDLVSDLAAR
jgi:hypothetical protein